MKTIWEITQIPKQLPQLNDPIFIEGLPGIGNVGKIAVDFLVEEMKAQKLYSFFSHKFPHSVFVGENNLVEMPKLDMYYKKFNNPKKRDILLLAGDIQPIDEESCYTFCEEVLKIVHHFQCQEVITTGGIGLHEVPESPKVFCTSNDLKLYQSYTKKENGIEKDIFGVVGPIIGVSGILLGLGKKRNVPAVSLLAQTFAHPLYLGIKGAKEVIRVLDSRFAWNVNIKRMNKEIVEVEKELIKKTKEWSSESATSQAGAKAKETEASYIG